MKFSRRRFLLGASTLAICAATPALAGLHLHGSSGFNGGKSQINFNSVAGTIGEYPFLNMMLTGANWSFANNSSTPVTPDLLDANGWPAVLTRTNPSGVYSSA